MPSPVKMRTLLETGVHFGHRTNKWNPKMAEFIFTARNGIHIIDLQQTLANLNEYYDMVRDLIADGGTVLFVGTKRQAQETIEEQAKRCGMGYVNTRWLGGTLTNFRTIRSRIETLKKLENDRDSGQFEKLTKKEAMMNERKIEKPAVHEANILRIPILGIIDTNGDPDVVDYIIPGNDDAMRSIRLLVSALAEAVIEGKAIRKGGDTEETAEEVAAAGGAKFDFGDDAEDEDLLGASTLSKLRGRKLDFDEEAK
jgi:small subunit ribosomal protein S2